MIRSFDILLSLIGLIILFPILLIIYLLIIIESKGGGFYLQKRVGKNGIDFTMFKFRSMFSGSEKKGLITIGKRDSRLTKMGLLIRKLKLDELPQLLNVLKGDMSIVGPRPEVHQYVDLYTEEQLEVLKVRPGLTDYASIKYANENIILGLSDDPERLYIKEIMPDKIELNMRYIENQNIKEYFRIIFRTIIHLAKKNNL
jgi:lipopolysaccharide/colanic/teichoic acid biosynthesis glycosyltransferase